MGKNNKLLYGTMEILDGGSPKEHERLCSYMKFLLLSNGPLKLGNEFHKAHNKFSKGAFSFPGGHGVGRDFGNLRLMVDLERPYCTYFEIKEDRLCLAADIHEPQQQHHLQGGGADSSSYKPPLPSHTPSAPAMIPPSPSSPSSSSPLRITNATQLRALESAIAEVRQASRTVGLAIGGGKDRRELTVAILSEHKGGDSNLFIVSWSLIKSPIIASILSDKSLAILVYDLYTLDLLLHQDFVVKEQLTGWIDMQLCAESMGKAFDAPLSSFVKAAAASYAQATTTSGVKGQQQQHQHLYYQSPQVWTELVGALFNALGEGKYDDVLKQAVRNRLDYIMSASYRKKQQQQRSGSSAGESRRVSFDSKRGAFASTELMEAMEEKGGADGGVAGLSSKTKPIINQDVQPLFDLVPAGVLQDPMIWQDESFSNRLIELVLDIGKRPRAKLTGAREPQYLHENESVVLHHHQLDEIASCLRIGDDNRAGIDGTLHRISVMRNRERTRIIGATLRVGRHVTGNIEFLRDLLKEDPHKMPSILIVGPPGAGKTTIIRELARVMSVDLRLEVVIIDTSNEIAGDGDIAHPAVGHSRRMMVRNLSDQANVMIEGVQNHTPEVMIIDEIGRTQEVKAARTIKERGTAVIGSAHGSFSSLLRNPDLKGLLGGCQRIILGDMEAKKKNKGEKIQIKREHAPVFDIVVELRREERNEWVIYRDVAAIVDSLYARKSYEVEYRSRDESSGQLYIRKVTGDLVYRDEEEGNNNDNAGHQ